jgi:inner membrane protein
MADPVEAFTRHRSFSHSLLVLTLVAPLLSWLVIRIHDIREQALQRRWWLAIWMVLITHPLLDSFTTYGTQIFWPIIDTPVSLSSIFIIDPAYTLPLLIAVLAVLLMRQRTSLARRINHWALAISTLYLGSTLLVKQHMEGRAEQALAASGAAEGQLFSTPAPLSILLWRFVHMQSDQYQVAYAGLFDGQSAIEFTAYPNGAALRPDPGQVPAHDRLAWFTHGFHSLDPVCDRLRVTDLRMGIEGQYVFAFDVASKDGAAWVMQQPVQITPETNLSRVSLVLDRIADSTVSIAAAVLPDRLASLGRCQATLEQMTPSVDQR